MTDPATPERGLLIVAHGERGAAAGNRALLEHAARVAERWPCILVQAAVLHGEPSFAQAVGMAAARGVRDLVLYPFFMTNGHTVKQMLAKHLRDVARFRISLVSPLGLDPGLPSLLLKESLRVADAVGFEPERTRLLVAAHGSRLAGDAAAAIARIAGNLRRRNIFASVGPAYLDQQPLLRDALRIATHSTVVAGCFAGQGVHARKDVPAAIEAAEACAAYTGPIGAHPEVADLIMNAIAAGLPPSTAESADQWGFAGSEPGRSCIASGV